jgi:hypothetical protein
MLFSQKQQAIMNRSVKEIAIKPMINQKDYRSAPIVDFITDPVELLINYYDYFPGGYDNSPLVIQPETTSSGYPAGGLYLGFQARETASANRRIYWAYFNADGQLIQCSNLSATNAWEGFPGTAMDPITGNPVIIYHRMEETYNVYASYDIYHVFGVPGYWKLPFTILENEDDEFIWPQSVIGPSPICNWR